MTDVLNDFPTDQTSPDTQSIHVGGGRPSGPGQGEHGHQSGLAGPIICITDQDHGDTHTFAVGDASSPHPTTPQPTPMFLASGGDPLADVHATLDTSSGVGEPSDIPPDQRHDDTHIHSVGWDVANAELVIYAKTHDELMAPRIACGNRIYQLGQYGLDGTREHARMVALHEAIHGLEHDATKALEGAMKRHPLGPWVMSQKGVGLKTAARLLALIGNPADRPNPAKLWAYCGWHVIDGAAPKRVKGAQSNWNTQAKTMTYLVAESCVKNRSSAYRDVYDKARAKYADAVHTTPCAQCGICDGCGKAPGKNKADHAETGCTDRRIRHAEPGDPLKDGHKHARAMRLVAKAFLLDLWKEARRLDYGLEVKS